jgi:hypothetical protein
VSEFFVRVWHVEFVDPADDDLGVEILSSEEEAERWAALYRDQGCLCVRVTGPHKHLVPDTTPTIDPP